MKIKLDNRLIYVFFGVFVLLIVSFCYGTLTGDNRDIQRADVMIKVFTGLFVAASSLLAAFTYWRNGSLERAKWLNQLHEKFFEKETYLSIRILLEYKGTNYDMLKDIVLRNSDTEPELQEKFVAYLNFFEYVATLWFTRQITTKEVSLLFGYYVKNFKKHDWIISFAKSNEFKNLPLLIAEVEKAERNK